MTTIAERLREARQRKGLSALALAKECGLTKGAVKHLESGRRKHPGSETLARLAQALDVSIDWLVTGEESSRGAPASLPSTGT